MVNGLQNAHLLGPTPPNIAGTGISLTHMHRKSSLGSQSDRSYYFQFGALINRQQDQLQKRENQREFEFEFTVGIVEHGYIKCSTVAKLFPTLVVT
jgi:hypothetical protein